MKLEQVFREEAVKRHACGQSGTLLFQNSGRANELIHVDKKMAELANVSHNTIHMRHQLNASIGRN